MAAGHNGARSDYETVGIDFDVAVGGDGDGPRSPCNARKSGSISLTVTSQQSYSIMTNQKVSPTLSIICAVKNKKGGHLITFTANGMLTEGDIGTTPRNGEIGLTMVINGKKEDTTWIPYTDVATLRIWKNRARAGPISAPHTLLTINYLRVHAIPDWQPSERIF